MKFFENKPALFLWIVVVLAGAALTLLFVNGESDQKFPVLTNGEYTGQITGLFGDDESRVPIIVSVKDRFVSAILMRPGWSKVTVERHAEYRDSPLEVSGPESRLRLSGHDNSDGTFAGTVYDLDAGEKGRWNLSKVDLPLVKYSDERTTEIKTTVLLRRELRALTNEQSELKSELDKEKEAIAKLNEFLGDTKKVTERAADKLKKVEASYASEEGEFRLKRKEARELAKKLALSERVTETGSLVSLSRKTIERENRWLESIFDTAGSLESFDLDKELARAERISFLKSQIAMLRRDRE